MEENFVIRLPEELSPGKVVFAAQAHRGPTGSMKDFMVRYALERAREAGELEAGCEVVEASSGNTGAALASACKELGHPARIFVTEHVSEEKRARIEKYGAKLDITLRGEAPQAEVRRSADYARENGAYLFDQFGNPYHLEGYRENLCPPIVSSLSEQGIKIDCFYGGVGSGASCIALGNALKENGHSALRVYGVVPERFPSEIEGLHPYHDSEFGAFEIWKNREKGFEEDVLKVSDEEAFTQALQLIDRGYDVGPGSGACLAAALRTSPEGSSSLILFCDEASKYESKYKKWRGTLEIGC